MKTSPVTLGLLLVLAALFVLGWLGQPLRYYPIVDGARAFGGQLTVLGAPAQSTENCREELARLLTWTGTLCPECGNPSGRCEDSLTWEQSDWLSVVAVPRVTAGLPGAVAVFGDADTARASAACVEFKRVLGARAGIGAQCRAPGVPRGEFPAPVSALHALAAAFPLPLLALLFTALMCALIVRSVDFHGGFSLDQVDGGPQKFHAHPTPRIGGIPVFAGALAALGWLALAGHQASSHLLAGLLVSALPAFSGGVIEDLTKRVGVSHRLLLTFASGALCAYLLGAVLQRLAIPGLDSLLKSFPVALALTIFAVGGLANAFNIIDGYNGLAPGSAILILLGLAGLALRVGDLEILEIALTMAGTVAGFLIWNWPGGRIFLGDGGAYLLGFLLAELGILLVIRNPMLSPWCPLMLMAHPVAETLFSIYRRRIHRGHHPGHPDALHLHQLVYSRLVRLAGGSRTPSERLRRNNRVALFFWPQTLFAALLLQTCWQSSRYPVGFTCAYFVFYVWIYGRLVSWRSPRPLIVAFR